VAESFEVVIGGSEDGAMLESERGGYAIHVRKLMARFQFPGSKSLRKVNGHDLEREERQVVDRLPGFLLTFVPPEPVKDFSEVDNGDHERGFVAGNFSKQAVHGGRARTILDVVQNRVGVKDVDLC